MPTPLSSWLTLLASMSLATPFQMLAPNLAIAQDTSAPSSGQPAAATGDEANQDATQSSVDTASVVVDDEIDTEGHGLLGPIRVGAMASAGIPALAHYSLESRFYRVAGLGVGFGGLGTKRNDLELKMSHWDIRARWFPFEGSLFLGTGYGASKYNATLKKTLELEAGGVKKKVPTTFKAEVERNELTPMLGWQWIFDPGFTMGLDFGWQLAMGSSSNLKISPEGLTPAEKALLEEHKDYKDNLKKVKDDFLDKYKGKGLPHVSLGFGWMI